MIVSPLPDNVHLLTFATREHNGGYLIRLEHQFEKTDDPQLSKPVTVSLAVRKFSIFQINRSFVVIFLLLVIFVIVGRILGFQNRKHKSKIEKKFSKKVFEKIEKSFQNRKCGC